jgi:NTP pyrophosphatase (non-canonical NTP hydrolase)
MVRKSISMIRLGCEGLKNSRHLQHKMSLNNYRDHTMLMCRQKGWDKANIPTVWLLFTEEVGELASAIRQYTRTFKKRALKKDRGVDVQSEMGDVFSYMFQLASMLNIDLDDMWIQHKMKVIEKNYNTNK